MQFNLLSHRQVDKEALWRPFHSLMLQGLPLVVNETKRFVELAETFKKKSDLLARLKLLQLLGSSTIQNQELFPDWFESH